MVFATVPEAAPTRRNHRATSCPAPISAKEPNVDGSRFTVSALWWVSSFGAVAIAGSIFEFPQRCEAIESTPKRKAFYLFLDRANPTIVYKELDPGYLGAEIPVLRVFSRTAFSTPPESTATPLKYKNRSNTMTAPKEPYVTLYVPK